MKLKTDYHCVTVRIEWVEGEASEGGRQIQDFLEWYEGDLGMARSEDHTEEGCVATYWVAALPRESYVEFNYMCDDHRDPYGEIPGVTVRDVDWDQAPGEGPGWDYALANICRPCELPAFAEGGQT